MMTLKELQFTLTRLWQYLNVYFLKPFDAVNDTLTASLLLRLDWDDEYLELGSGDGIFSFIMHGGQLPLSFDRYLLTDTKLTADIYDHHISGIISVTNIPDSPIPYCSIDRKLSHLHKINEIGYSRSAVLSGYEKLPIADSTVHSVFCYTPHGLEDHGDAIREAARIMCLGARLRILVYDKEFSHDFISYRLSKILPGKLGEYFKQIDGGRYAEITSMSRTKEEWNQLFSDLGFSVTNVQSGLSGLAWRAYDIQTRPILKSLINLFNSASGISRIIVKTIWMIAIYPIILLFYILFANRILKIGGYDCYLAYHLVKRRDTHE
jgi:hypothetical protein